MLKPRYYFADDFTNTSLLSLTQSEYFRKVITSGNPDSRMIASNTMYPVHPFTFLSTKVGDEKSSAFTAQGRFSPVITQMTSVLSRL